MKKPIIITTGLALFAMFFGAGNIVFPLILGREAGSNIHYALSAFLIAGVGLPFLGLFATSLYQGDYWQFFRKLGKIPSFLLISFLILIIGPLFAIPRTEAVTYNTLGHFLPEGGYYSYYFSAFYCVLIFCLTYRPTKVVDIIGHFLSPIKLGLFAVLIVAGIFTAKPILANQQPVLSAVKMGLLDGYGTMDLLGAFFFCTIAYRSIVLKAKNHGITDPKTIIRLFLHSCLVGSIILSLVYIGFTYIALTHAADLQNVETAQMIGAISTVILGKYGSLFVAICVSFACIATATALAEVATNFFYENVFKRKISRHLCLIAILIVSFIMSILGFAGIMKIALPILEILYPALIVYCLFAIAFKFYTLRKKVLVVEESQTSAILES